MTRIWKYVAVIVILLLAFGVLLAGTGLLTGAEAERVWRVLDGQHHLDALKNALETVKQTLFSLF